MAQPYCYLHNADLNFKKTVSQIKNKSPKKKCSRSYANTGLKKQSSSRCGETPPVKLTHQEGKPTLQAF